MKKIIYLLLVLTALISLNTLQAKAQTQSKVSEEKSRSLSSEYELYATKNMWFFIKLDTRNGKMSQVHFSLDLKSYRGEQSLNDIPLVYSYEEEVGRFALYPTQNTFNFILLDKISGRTYQVQWSLEAENRMVIPLIK